MTSIQLPPLQFEDGGFRVSIIQGSSATPGGGRPFPRRQEPQPEPESVSESKPHAASKSFLNSGSQSTSEDEDGSVFETASVAASSKLDLDFPQPRRVLTPRAKTPTSEIEIQIDAEPMTPPERLTDASDQIQIELDIEPRPSISDSILRGENNVTEMPTHDDEALVPNIPSHPIPLMQLAFAESLAEVTTGPLRKPRLREFDARQRRERLLGQTKDDEPFDAPWRYRPGQKEHEVVKLLSQISFGVYLLLNGMANDHAQVVGILQGHIDEVDEFLEVTLEDLAEALADLEDRILSLRETMSTGKDFEERLEDRNYRAEILENNEEIDHILARMNVIMRQWDDDVEAGLHGVSAFKEWLQELRDGPWRNGRPDLVEIHDAMKGNADAWLNAFDETNSRAQDLNSLIIKLMTITAEMAQKAGEVSRKTWSTIPPYTSPISGSLKSKTSISSPPSVRSNPMSNARISIRSGSTSFAQLSMMEDGDSDDGLEGFPLPGVTPLLPPTRYSGNRVSKKMSIETAKWGAELSASKPPTVQEVPEEEKEDGPLYLLQPRTYTPVLPEPMPSPRVKEAPAPAPSTTPTSTTTTQQQHEALPQIQSRGSIRHRVSLKGAPPEDILIPPTVKPGGVNGRGSPAFVSRRSHNNHHLQTGDLEASYHRAQGSSGSSMLDVDAHRQHALPRVASHAELGPARPPLMASPSSDFQHYHPVRASPHSPLQQRPHTAAGPQPYPTTPSYPQHLRGQPSRLGSIAPTSAGDQTTRQGTPSVQTGRTVKKKKSAFGWFKKAFTMDDDEKAAFEARRQMDAPDNYYKDKSPKFLDGKRLR
ncbi:uncharacterized protein J7T54_008348 [Emericellopsis cladophorae]|uniref:Uncharacterized protein n=1 Tax=Emericellopsis cladophorae TaxID=2686198 RepID=A0A9P9Y2F2_9HYPO|nr:uncharacterized protein J7T54_008348 [Emericellopsis cladophorae]KAI6782262.1 hypothetical protein J7T54_008348 [Emericellopsis cladophorae]